MSLLVSPKVEDYKVMKIEGLGAGGALSFGKIKVVFPGRQRERERESRKGGHTTPSVIPRHDSCPSRVSLGAAITLVEILL